MFGEKDLRMIINLIPVSEQEEVWLKIHAAVLDHMVEKGFMWKVEKKGINLEDYK